MLKRNPSHFVFGSFSRQISPYCSLWACGVPKKWKVFHNATGHHLFSKWPHLFCRFHCLAAALKLTTYSQHMQLKIRIFGLPKTFHWRSVLIWCNKECRQTWKMFRILSFQLNGQSLNSYGVTTFKGGQILHIRISVLVMGSTCENSCIKAFVGHLVLILNNRAW